MKIDERSYPSWRTIHAWSGVAPIGLFLLFHFVTNAIAVAGPAAFRDAAARLEAVPFVRGLEALLIALPITFHVALGIALGNASPAILEDRYPSRWMRPAQRITAGYLVVYLVFHVWGTRLSPDFLKRGSDWFGLMQHQLENPAMLIFYALGVLAAAAHFGIGVVGLAGYARASASPIVRRPWLRIGLVLFLLLTLVGLNALFAFVARPARWLEPRSNAISIEVTR